ncbi:MAG TPA: hypothetical protein PLL75_06030 [Candidatus Omnitrophota bacterium]|nr:hypothetical protein [Candidatus Omnitrophota bacterium]HPS37267.1 hypothetical protein [Candidatus Omnitrophota bacterium]
MDEKDRLLLTYLHQGLSFVSRPFEVLAQKTQLDSAGVMVRIQKLKQEGILTGIKAVWNPRAFGYQSAWVAMKFDPAELAGHSEIVHQHPGVIYSCEREHELNFWFFIAVPGDHDLETHLRCIEKFAAPKRTLFLPVRRVFKGTDLLNVTDPGMFPGMGEHFEKRKTVRAPELSAPEIELVRALQEKFPVADDPFRDIAVRMNVSEGQVLELTASLVRRGCLRRIGSFFNPAAVFGKPKHLVVWHISEEKLDRGGAGIAEFQEIVYADRRPSYPGFPYSLYTMIEATDATELEVIVRRIEDRIGKWPSEALVTAREFKKNRMKYFPKELDVWWEQSRHVAETAFH